MACVKLEQCHVLFSCAIQMSIYTRTDALQAYTTCCVRCVCCVWLETADIRQPKENTFELQFKTKTLEEHRPPPRRTQSRSGQTPDPGDFLPEFCETSLSKNTSSAKLVHSKFVVAIEVATCLSFVDDKRSYENSDNRIKNAHYLKNGVIWTFHQYQNYRPRIEVDFWVWCERYGDPRNSPLQPDCVIS